MPRSAHLDGGSAYTGSSCWQTASKYPEGCVTMGKHAGALKIQLLPAVTGLIRLHAYGVTETIQDDDDTIHALVCSVGEDPTTLP